MKYFEDREFVIKRAKFTYDGALFDGHGFMEWNKEEGFQIKLFVESEEYKKPQAQTLGASSVIKKSDRQNIHLYFGNSIGDIGLYKAMVPAAYLGKRFDILMTDTLSIRVPQLVFLRDNFQSDSSYYFGKAVYKLGKGNYNFPETIHKQEKIGEEDFSRGWSHKGIKYKTDQEYLRGRVEEGKYLYIRFGFKKDKYTQAFALNFPCGFRYAISLILGMEAKRLKSEVNGKNTNVKVIKKLSEVKDMPIYRGLNSFKFFSSELVWDLSVFLTHGYIDRKAYKEAYVARMIINQLLEAEQQETFAGRELLTSTILEAIIRTLYNLPYQQIIKVENYMKDLVRDYADGAKWRRIRVRVYKAFDNLRNRNAHLDWLVDNMHAYEDENISDTFLDLRILIKFYQQLILLMAGIDVQPELPEKI